MDDLRMPGAWLDDEMSEAEGAQFMELSNIMAQLKTEKDPSKIITAVAPYMNSLMHIMYLLIKSKLNLEATDDGVRYKENKELFFDIISYTVDFVINEYDLHTLWQTPQGQLNTAITSNLLSSAYAPMYSGALVNDFMQINTRGVKADSFTKKAVIKTKDGHKFTIEHFDKLLKALSTPAKKILSAAIIYLASVNYYNTQNVTATAEIPLIEFGEKCGYQLTPRTMPTPEEQIAENKAVQQRIKDFKKDVRRDLRDIKSVTWTAEETKGRNRGDYSEISIISSHRIINGLIIINFDVDAAAYLAKSYLMQHPNALFAVDNRNPNAYVLGYKIAQHNSMDVNVAKGTNNTLSVESLLTAAPEIQSIEELKAKGQRNWKDKIKRPLENSLNELIKVGVLRKWEYRDPTTGKTYTSDTAQPMTWAQYSRLMVDFIIINAPDQSKRREANADDTTKKEKVQKTAKMG